MSAERARDPETPPEELRTLARTYPEEVLANPALPLILMEDPVLGPKIFWLAKYGVLDRQVVSLAVVASETALQDWIAACVAHVEGCGTNREIQAAMRGAKTLRDWSNFTFNAARRVAVGKPTEDYLELVTKEREWQLQRLCSLIEKRSR